MNQWRTHSSKSFFPFPFPSHQSHFLVHYCQGRLKREGLSYAQNNLKMLGLGAADHIPSAEPTDTPYYTNIHVQYVVYEILALKRCLCT